MEMDGGLRGEKRAQRRGEEKESWVPQKLSRSDSFPFRIPPPFSRCEGDGPTFYNYGDGRSSDIYDVPAGAVPVSVAGAGAGAASVRTMQPFPSALKSPGMASLRFPFTPSQWQELEQQALIFKYMMASVPVPQDLVNPIRKSLPLSHPNLGWGPFSLRFANATDPEPGRCRRTDGKKWRCSRDVAPDQKYCERHMHRGRPRSRKPVELQIQNNQTQPNDATTSIAAAASSSTLTPHPSPCSSSPATLCSLNPSALSVKPYQSSGFVANKASCSNSEFKVPSPNLISAVQDKDSSRFLDWMKGEAAGEQWQLMQQKGGRLHPRLNSSANTHVFNYNDELNLVSEPEDIRVSSAHFSLGSMQNSNQSGFFFGSDLTTLEPERQPRHFIDAWSQTRDSSWPQGTEKPLLSSASKLSLSSLTLSMSGNEEDIDPVQMGLGLSDSERESSIKRQPLSWMMPVSWQSSTPGGPLAEVLQSSTPTNAASPNNCNGKSSSGGLNLMTDGWGEANSRDSPKQVSSPTGVLQKTLASLSDSSSGSSPTFAAKSELALQWLHQQKLPPT
ncbi:hypothetical protein AMTRI_Chr09g17830 [Amborella trichopoda]